MRALDPKWWRQEVGALGDLDHGLLFDRRCDECGGRRGTRVVLVDEGSGPPPSPDPADHRFRFWCARCICEDMDRPPTPYSGREPDEEEPMSFTANLSGHFADEAKNVQALEIVRAAVADLDALGEDDDTLTGSWSGPTVADPPATYSTSVLFPEPAVADEQGSAAT